MKAMDLLTLFGKLDDSLLTPPEPTAPARRTVKVTRCRALTWVAAACVCIGLLGFAAWFFVPPLTVTDNSYQITVIRLEDRLAAYRYINTRAMSRFEKFLLPDTPGELLAIHGGCRFYRAEGEDDLVYILQETGNGDYDLLTFDGYVPFVGIDMTESYWYTSGWLTDEDLAALQGGEEPTLMDLLDTIYSVASAEDIEWVRFSKSGAYNGGVSKEVKVKSVTVTDRQAIERLYGLFPRFHTEEYGQQRDYGYVNAHDKAYLTGQKPLSAQVNREVTIRLTSGREIICQYFPATGVLRQNVYKMYTNLSEEDNAWLIDLAEIDMAWRDWGTEAPPFNGEGCETATVPPMPTQE